MLRDSEGGNVELLLVASVWFWELVFMDTKLSVMKSNMAVTDQCVSWVSLLFNLQTGTHTRTHTLNEKVLKFLFQEVFAFGP